MDLDQLDAALRSFQECRILLTSLELNVYTLLETPAAAADVASRLGAAPRALRALLDALVSLGMLEKRSGVYFNTEFSARYLTDSSPECARPALMHHAHRWHSWSRLTERIQGIAPPEHHRGLDPGRHRSLLAMLHRKSARRAPLLIRAIGAAGVRRILDLGGGSGAYSLAFAGIHPAIEAEVFELPEIVPITREYIAQAGLLDRVITRAGDFLTAPLGSGFDLILLFSVTHLLGEEENRALLARCFAALNPGGRVAIHDHVLDAGKTHPRAGAIFALNMLLVTPNGSTYSFDEYSAWLRACGFASVERRPIEGLPTELLIAARS